ncbi:hypothetical protein NDU88_001990 [Pleurodeles waltl]|uniref:Uncharacterized protein n=1 Tax=Pleurodeles waltl TaxID=8319 RepID=A0AAV7NHB2_PLEWA|nr:hypothetical protein NDU88_001990 [Pleurodeles waltl]
MGALMPKKEATGGRCTVLVVKWKKSSLEVEIEALIKRKKFDNSFKGYKITLQPSKETLVKAEELELELPAKPKLAEEQEETFKVKDDFYKSSYQEQMLKADTFEDWQDMDPDFTEEGMDTSLEALLTS